ncbi:MAG: GNAT family N-acetyltransferase [Lachnospiraceae bacterium]|nr:GNAT family N-acetyltransferase [Lachnospiraceae bacterium]
MEQSFLDEGIFAENDNFILSKYKDSEQELFYKAWNETFENSPVLTDINFKEKSWEDVLTGKSKLQLKIIDTISQEYIGEVVLLNIDSEMPEFGIQLLRKYQGKGIGTMITKLFLDKLKSVTQVKEILIRIRSNNEISKKMFEKFGIVKIGEEGKKCAELMASLLDDIGKDKFENIVGKSFASTQVYTICYKLPLE